MCTQSMHAHDHAEQAAIPVAHQFTHVHNHAEQAAIPVIHSAHACERIQATSLSLIHSALFEPTQSQSSVATRESK